MAASAARATSVSMASREPQASCSTVMSMVRPISVRSSASACARHGVPLRRLVGADDAPDEIVSHHVLFLEDDMADAFKARQEGYGFAETRALPRAAGRSASDRR